MLAVAGSDLGGGEKRWFGAGGGRVSWAGQEETAGKHSAGEFIERSCVLLLQD